MKKIIKKTAMLAGQNKSLEQTNEAVEAVLIKLAQTDKLLKMGLAQSPKSDPILNTNFVDGLVLELRQNLKPPKKESP
ncbi:MAG: hypothetical protein EKK47_06080 [Burkholderiales bacterium]|nr:MAG: hypothetical protein EKK47_06080 [Burkholderiales bacterium]